MVQTGAYRQKTTLFLLVVCTRVITGLIGQNWTMTGTGQVFSLLIGAILGLTGAASVIFLCRRVGKPLYDALTDGCGAFIGRAIALWYALFLLFNAQSLLVILSGLTAERALPDVPTRVILFAAAGSAAIAGASGLDALGRFARLIAPVTALFLAISLALPYENYHPDYLFPLLGYGAEPIWKLGLGAGADFFGLILFGTLYRKNEPGFGKALLTLTGTAAGVCLLFFLSTAMLFPYTADGVMPLFDLPDVISAGQHTRSLASLFSMIWTPAFLLTNAVQDALCAEALTRAFPALRSRRRLCTAMIAVFALLLALPDHQTARYAFLRSPLWGWLALYPPLFLGVILTALRKKGVSR